MCCQVIHDVLPVNDRLYRHGVYGHNTPCHFCDNSAETIDHLFVCCNFLLPLWNYISILLGKYSGYPVVLDRKCILFNVFQVSRDTK